MENLYQAQGRVEMLQGRAKRCLCKYCGEHLRLKRIIFSDYDDARVELYCDHCERIEYGVEPEIYYSAKYFVDQLEFSCFPSQDDNDITYRMNVAKVCEIMAWGHKNIGILDKDGFKVALNMNKSIIGECIILNDDDLYKVQER